MLGIEYYRLNMILFSLIFIWIYIFSLVVMYIQNKIKMYNIKQCIFNTVILFQLGKKLLKVLHRKFHLLSKKYSTLLICLFKREKSRFRKIFDENSIRILKIKTTFLSQIVEILLMLLKDFVITQTKRAQKYIQSLLFKYTWSNVIKLIYFYFRNNNDHFQLK